MLCNIVDDIFGVMCGVYQNDRTWHICVGTL